MRKILIGIQARSDSKRFPNKVHHNLGGKTILQRVIDACENAAKYVKRAGTYDCDIKVVLLTPHSDPIASLYGSKIAVLQGDKDDVLSRYVSAAQLHEADYIVRITADCAEMESHIVAKHIKSALVKGRDYTTNTHYRSFIEGLDCEVISRRLLTWLDDNAEKPFDREHVTTLIAKDREFPYVDAQGRKNICHIISQFYLGDVKTSIDTQDDLRRAIERQSALETAQKEAARNGITFQ